MQSDARICCHSAVCDYNECREVSIKGIYSIPYTHSVERDVQRVLKGRRWPELVFVAFDLLLQRRNFAQCQSVAS